MALCETEKFVYLKEPASGVLKLSIDKGRCVMFAFSQRLEIEVFLNPVESNNCQIEEENCGGGGDQKGSTLGTQSNSCSTVVEVAGPASTGSDMQLTSETETDIGLISDDDNVSGAVTRSETLRRQRNNNNGIEKLNKEAENENNFISVDAISTGHVIRDIASQQARNSTRKVGTDAKAHSFPWIHIKANVPTKTNNNAKDSNVMKNVKLKETMSLSQTSRYKSSNANINLTSTAAKEVIKIADLKKCQTDCETTCPYCHSVFQNQRLFYRHTKTKRVARFECKNCPKIFSFEAFLQAHTKYDHSEIARDSESVGYKCDFCGTKFTTFFCLKKHLMFHTKEYYYKCCICGKQFVQDGPLKNHMASHTTGGMIRCSCCGKLFTTRGALCKHRLAMATVKCHLCGKNFPNKTSRTMHYKESHQNDIIKCVQCTRLFSSEEDLAAHMKNHAMCKKKQCTICGTFVFQLQQHMVIHKSKSELDESQLLVCDKCPRKFKSRSAFHRHRNTHSSEKPYQCPHCPKTFQDCEMLRGHLTNHSSYMPYQCEVCGKKCKVSSGLKSHMRRHSDTKNYPCPLCPRAFNYKSSRDRHVKTRHPANEGSSDSVSGQLSDYPHVYNTTLAQEFIQGQDDGVPVAQHVEVSFTIEELVVASSCLQLHMGHQQE